MTILDTIGVFVLIPAAIVTLAGLLTILPTRIRSAPTYRPGDTWTYRPQLWGGDAPVVRSGNPTTSVGGARGTW